LLRCRTHFICYVKLVLCCPAAVFVVPLCQLRSDLRMYLLRTILEYTAIVTRNVENHSDELSPILRFHQTLGEFTVFVLWSR
jgi:hypothetical protein